jgi:hypothetical protein
MPANYHWDARATQAMALRSYVLQESVNVGVMIGPGPGMHRNGTLPCFSSHA